MKIQPTNNVSHKAYFKNDSAGFFKKYWQSPICITPRMEALATELRTKCPNHPLELIKVDAGYDSSKNCEILNTVTGQKLKVVALKSENFIEKILSTLVEKAEENNIFFDENSKYAKFFKEITGQ